MFPILGRLAHRLLADASRHATPRCIAVGAAIGGVLGLIPWDSLIAVGLVVAAFVLPIHQLSAVLALLLTSSLHGVVSPIPDAVGGWVLSSSWTLEGLRRIWSVPLVPWLRLNNTMVVGSVFLGTLTAVPHWAVLRWCMQPAGAIRERAGRADDALDEIALAAAQFRKGFPKDHPPSELSISSNAIGELNPPPNVDPDMSNHRVGLSSADSRSSPQSSSSSKSAQPMIAETSTTSMDSNRMPNATGTRPANNLDSSATGSPSHAPSSERVAPCQRTLSGPGSNDALRYLLRHLTASRAPRDGATTP